MSSFLNTDIIHQCLPRHQTPFCCPSAFPIGKYYPVQTPIRCYKCINNPESSNDSIRIQYDTQKKIQKTVGVSASLYMHDLASITTAPTNKSPWNNMSDRVAPHSQKKYKSMILSTYRPGSLSPGGIGCDIKHNSYVRYLNKLKGKSSLRKDPIPASFGTPIIRNNCANPIYGNKQVKTSIISCPSCRTLSEINSTPLSIDNGVSYYQPYVFIVGQMVYLMNPISKKQVKGEITAYDSISDTYTVFINPEYIQTKGADMYLAKC